MCGRFSLISIPEEELERLGLILPDTFVPRYNIAPTQPSWTVLAGDESLADATDKARAQPAAKVTSAASKTATKTGDAPAIAVQTAVRKPGPPHRFTSLNFGLRPDWAKRPIINARSETLQDKPFFRALRPCLIPADGFYEWKDSIPYCFTTDRFLWFAALADHSGFCIITGPANTSMRPYHERMPAIIHRGKEAAWLTQHAMDTGAVIVDWDIALRPTPVSLLLNSPKNDSKDVLERP
ncbi:hypothetical protein COY28_01265 [Candidatus Woesearchaeota archaeon CG_4_10_14_0_2_um_filter_57_5]|nr:MAG: hypothetical protein AUJ68_06450 [Candidatus Woesearchaeota archaeon CG1_02_57_44]PIZ56101.1 MAG: hypothetical protein COY28_01265 [Candidatus Woesearchaeota archaeon CG_4_10_14_0_2_um_filter_57_5]